MLWAVVAFLTLWFGIAEAGDYTVQGRGPILMADYVRIEIRVDATGGKAYTIDTIWPAGILSDETPTFRGPDVTIDGTTYGMQRHHHFANRALAMETPTRWVGIRGRFQPRWKQTAAQVAIAMEFPMVMLRQLRDGGAESVMISLEFPHGGARGMETVSFSYVLQLKDLYLGSSSP